MEVCLNLSGSHFTICVNQAIMLCTLKFYSDLYINYFSIKSEKNILSDLKHQKRSLFHHQGKLYSHLFLQKFLWLKFLFYLEAFDIKYSVAI